MIGFCAICCVDRAERGASSGGLGCHAAEPCRCSGSNEDLQRWHSSSVGRLAAHFSKLLAALACSCSSKCCFSAIKGSTQQHGLPVGDEKKGGDGSDKFCASTGDVPVVVVGGGAALCDDSLEGASSVIRPPFASVANAVGAAIPQV
jgi:hypothetical protein